LSGQTLGATDSPAGRAFGFGTGLEVLPGIVISGTVRAAWRRLSCSGESEERITLSRNLDISASTFSG
jgi:hypothetical protein